MSEGAVAERYAQALLELGQEGGELEKLAGSMRDLASALETSRELRSVAYDPTVAEESRTAVLRGVCAGLGMSKTAENAVLLIAKRRRLPVIAAIARRLTELADDASGVLRGSVTTAKPMPESFYGALSESIARATGRRIILSRSTDDTLIGGAVARVGDTTIDASVRGQLRDLERELLVALGADR